MNRRMHNKAFIVDGAAAIVGGRNIGNEYFELGDAVPYLDLDVLGIGPVAIDTTAIFDAYWNSASSIMLEKVITGPGDIAEYAREVARARTSEVGGSVDEIAATVAARLSDERGPPLFWTNVRVVADDPAKGTGNIERDKLMIFQLENILGDINRRLDLISAYFVPSKFGEQEFAQLAERGVEVNILTNSWQATDVPMVHAGYTKYRRDLLEAGVRLFELKPVGDEVPAHVVRRPFGTSGSSLHAKTFVADDARLLIGSFNFDPRSAALNCEMGFLIESPDIARRASAIFANDIVLRSYRPELQGDKIVWHDPQPDGSTNVIENEPGLRTGRWIYFLVLNLLPIEWLL